MFSPYVRISFFFLVPNNVWGLSLLLVFRPSRLASLAEISAARSGRSASNPARGELVIANTELNSNEVVLSVADRLRFRVSRRASWRLPQAEVARNRAAVSPEVLVLGSSQLTHIFFSAKWYVNVFDIFQSNDDVITSFLSLHPLLNALSDSFKPDVTSDAQHFRALVLDMVVAEHVVLRKGVAPPTAKHGTTIITSMQKFDRARNFLLTVGILFVVLPSVRKIIKSYFFYIQE